MRERFAALRNLPPFLRDIWRTSPSLALSSLVLRLARALLPIATLYVGKLIVDEVVRLVGLGAGTLDFAAMRSEEHTSELQSLMRISYAVFCLKKKTTTTTVKLSTHDTITSEDKIPP